MSGRRGAPQRPQGQGRGRGQAQGQGQGQQGPLNPPGRVLFETELEPLNVNTADADRFERYIEQVHQLLRARIHGALYYGDQRQTMVLPCPQAAEMTWFVIVLEARDRENRYRVRFFIEAETIYLHGYQNQAGVVFEFAPETGGADQNQHVLGGRQPEPAHVLGATSRHLSFSCNYVQLVRATEHKGPGGSVLDPGLTLKQGQAVPMPNFGQNRLKEAVSELARADNSGSQHLTAQSLLIVIIRFCESIRFRSVREEMSRLWNSIGSISRSISSHGVEQINSWGALASKLHDSARYGTVTLSRQFAEDTGISTLAEARDILVVIKYLGDPNDPANPTPRWLPPPDNYRRHGGGGPGPGPGGAAGGVHAADLPRWCPVPENPVMRILSVVIAPGQVVGVYGRITVTDCFGTQIIYLRDWENHQRNQAYYEPTMTLQLDALSRPIYASDRVDINIYLMKVSPAALLASGLVSWSAYNCRTNLYGQAVLTRVGPVFIEYIVNNSSPQGSRGSHTDLRRRR